MNHLVILHGRYLDLILAGTKTVESRLSKRRHSAATRCRPGDTLYLKRAGGDVEARCRASGLTEFHNLPPGGIARLAEEWWPRVVGDGPDDAYWAAKRDARHALFIELGDVERFHIPRGRFARHLPWASGWIVGQPEDELVRGLGAAGLP